MKNYAVFFLILSSVIATSCTSSSKKIIQWQQGSNRLFPEGNYRHNVQLKFKNPSQAPQSLNGVVQITKEKISVVGFSPFGTTVFKIHENLLEQKIICEIYIEKLKKQESFLTSYYKLIRNMMLSEKPKSNNLPLKIELKDSDTTARLEIQSYDKNNIPEKLKLITKDVEIFVESRWEISE